MEQFVSARGRPSCLIFTTCGPDGQPSQEYRTLFLQELLQHGVLAQSFVISAAHTDEDLEITIRAVECALEVYRVAIERGSTAGNGAGSAGGAGTASLCDAAPTRPRGRPRRDDE